METTLDKFGRVVIPKQLREDLGLQPGSVLQIKHDDQKIFIEPVHEEPTLVVKEGVLVYQGIATGNIEGAIKTHRQERLNKVASGIKK
jgi:AbrB family looped-hinge helix DNA binding protein